MPFGKNHYDQIKQIMDLVGAVDTCISMGREIIEIEIDPHHKMLFTYLLLNAGYTIKFNNDYIICL